MEMACHAIGSRAIEAFFASDISQKTKNKVLASLKVLYIRVKTPLTGQGRIAKLAMDTYGSHTIDKCWAAVCLLRAYHPVIAS